MEPFTPTTARMATEQVLAAINANTQYEAIQTGGARYEDERVFIKIEIKQEGAPSQQQADLTWAHGAGMTKWQAGDKLHAFGDRYKVIGWNRKAKKKPLIVESLKSRKVFVIHAQNPNTEYIPAVGRSEWEEIID
jgi:hypothetical protein